MKNLTNCCAIVTGGASGMGAATATLLASQGCKVAVLDMNLEKARSVADSIDGIAIKCDVSSALSGESALEQVKETIGAARILVNCAGIAPSKRIVGRQGVMPLEDFSNVVEVNLIGTFNMLRLAANAMVELEPDADTKERGVIINTASAAAFEGQVGQAAYSASKGGILSLTLTAARDLATLGIRVMTIAPGIIQTPMITAMSEEVQKSLAQQMPFPKRLGHVSEYAELALHIIKNSYLNGETIRLDAAVRMQPK